MAKHRNFPKPFFRASRGLWYVQSDGRQINLGPDRTAAFAEYAKLITPSQPAAVPAPAPAGEPLYVVVVIDTFLTWCEANRAADTYRWYKDRLNSFCQSIPPLLTLSELKPYHVQQWVDARKDLSATSRRNLIASVKRAMKWAEEQGFCDRSPVAHVKKPGAGRKELVVTQPEFEKIRGLTKDQEFRDLLTVTWETGCRPQESLRVEARHAQMGEHPRWVFPPSEAKGGRLPRVIYLTPNAAEITKRLMEKHPEGPLFRNVDGKPWTPDATNYRFQRIKKQLKVKYSLYSLRHTYATRALQQGIDSLTVALLLGHSDPSTVAKTYQHLSQSPSFLAGQAKRVAG